jgi:hypothetical protein
VTAPPGLDPGVFFQLATWFNPGGVVAVDAGAVVPPRAEPYVVLPEAFGLSALVATGALELRSGIILPTLYIARPIPRFPAGLYGSESATFILGRGVPLPPGDPGHSCVISEEPGMPIANDFICSLGD